MDILKIKQNLIDNTNNLISVLEYAGFDNIKNNGKEIRCAYEKGGNPTAVAVNTNTLFSNCFSRGVKGDIFTLLGHKLNYDMPRELPKILKLICNKLGIEYTPEALSPNIRLPFGGFYKTIKQDPYYNPEVIEVYDKNILKDYGSCVNLRFLKDGISAETQYKFKVGYDNLTDRITVPWYTPAGELCGVMGRINFNTSNEDMAKWFPVIPFKKSQTLYGYNINYNNILEKEIAFIGESEKFTMQLDSMGINVGLSLGGSNISTRQANLVKSLNPQIIIVCYDEGLDLDYIIDNVTKLKSHSLFYNNKVGYVYDRYNHYLPKGSKLSPSDLGKDVFKELINKCVIWI